MKLPLRQGIPTGSHALRIEKKGYQPYRRNLAVERAQAIILEVQLEKAKADDLIKRPAHSASRIADPDASAPHSQFLSRLNRKHPQSKSPSPSFIITCSGPAQED